MGFVGDPVFDKDAQALKVEPDHGDDEAEGGMPFHVFGVVLLSGF